MTSRRIIELLVKNLEPEKCIPADGITRPLHVSPSILPLDSPLRQRHEIEPIENTPFYEQGDGLLFPSLKRYVVTPQRRVLDPPPSLSSKHLWGPPLSDLAQLSTQLAHRPEQHIVGDDVIKIQFLKSVQDPDLAIPPGRHGRWSLNLDPLHRGKVLCPVADGSHVQSLAEARTLGRVWTSSLLIFVDRVAAGDVADDSRFALRLEK